MARARQEGSSPEPVEGLARDGPRPFPLSRLVPSAVSCGLCEPGLPAAPAAPALLPAAYLCAPTALPAVTAALGGPRWPGGPRSRPRGPRPDGECLPHTRDGGSWARDTEEWPSGSGRGEVASRPGHREGVACVVFVLQEAGRRSGKLGGGGTRSGKSLLESDCSPRVAARGLSQPLSPSLGPFSSREDCRGRECGTAGRTVTSGLWGGVEGGLLPLSVSFWPRSALCAVLEEEGGGEGPLCWESV